MGNPKQDDKLHVNLFGEVKHKFIKNNITGQDNLRITPRQQFVVK